MSNVLSLRLSILAGLFLVLGVATASAQSKVAVINLQRALMETAEIKRASGNLEAKYKPRQTEMQKLQTELQQIESQLRTGADKLSPSAQSELNLQMQLKQRRLQRLGEDLQQEVEQERNQILAASGQRMQAIVTKLAEEKQFDMVVDVADTIYFRPTLEITEEAIAAYDQAHPAN